MPDMQNSPCQTSLTPEQIVTAFAAQHGLQVKTLPSQQEQKEMEGKAEKKKRRPKKLPKFLTEDEAAQLFSRMDTQRPIGIRDMTILQTMYKAGLRVSEAVNLLPGNIYWGESAIFVQNGKGGKDRWVPFASCLMEWLKKWDAIRDQEAQYFFHNKRGQRLTDRYIRYVLADLSEFTGVFIQDGLSRKPVHPHNLRHSYATDLLRKGANIREVQLLLGHESLNTTQIYLGVSNAELAAKIQAIG